MILKLIQILTLVVLIQSCGSKRINELEARNDNFNKRYSTKPEKRTIPMLNQLHNKSSSEDNRVSFYENQELLYKTLQEKNDRYFYDMVEFIRENEDINTKFHETLPVGNSYFLDQFFQKTGTTIHNEQSLYFQYLKFLINSKNDEYKKRIVDPIQTVVRVDSDSFIDNNFIFTREKIKEDADKGQY